MREKANEIDKKELDFEFFNFLYLQFMQLCTVKRSKYNHLIFALRKKGEQ